MVRKWFIGAVAIIGLKLANAPRSEAQVFNGQPQQFATQPYSAPYVGFWYLNGHGYPGVFADPVFYGTMAYSSGINPQTRFPAGVSSWNAGVTPMFNAGQPGYLWYGFGP